ncbi:MAG TPA: ABC transporter permease [Polyangiaceae bacterium]|nr:ABC transporter permease [Polyangiaceae bacterium]
MRFGVSQPSPDRVSVTLAGDLTLDEARAAYDTLLELADRPDIREVWVDFAAVEAFDSPAAGSVSEACERLRDVGKRVELVNVGPRQRSTFELVLVRVPPPAAAPRPPSLATRLRTSSRRLVRGAYDFADLVLDTVGISARVLVRRERARCSSIVDQAVHLGVNAFPVVLLLSFLTGLILAFQAAYQLRRFGVEIYMADVVSLGMVREFSPIMTAIILAGRSGAAMTAEIGTMAVREELSALQTTGINPNAYLVFPRLCAVTLAQPALTVLSMAIGIGAGLITAFFFGLPVPGVYAAMQETLTTSDFALGISKSVLFAWVIGFTACFMGQRTRGGARAVGRNTTVSVVAAILLIVLVDSLVTTTWTTAGHGDV